MTKRLAFLFLLVVWLVWEPLVARAAGPIPEMSAIEKAVLQHFAAKRDYRPGDMLTRDMASPLIDKLRRLGLPLPDAKQILDSLPTPDSFLAKQFATPGGQRFMRQIASYPGGYDRLDRLSQMPRGEQTVRDLIRGPDGYKMVEYMTTTEGGRELGKMLANSPDGRDFNAPTGRIYTADELLNRIEKSRTASVKAAARKGKK